MVAAEAREFEGILRRFGTSRKLDWPARFAREASWKGARWLLIANGPGTNLAREALETRTEVSGIMSTGFCGALDPALRVGDIVISGAAPRATPAPFATGEILSTDHVAITAAEKRKLYADTGAIAIEMEAAAVRHKAADWSVPFYCIKSVSDTAADDMPLDFNLYRDAEGRFARGGIAVAALIRPFTVAPALLRLNRNCTVAADALGEFLANCRF